MSDVVRLTLDPTLAPITKLPTFTVTVELLALNEPIVNPVDLTFDVEELSATVILIELAFRLAVLFPIWTPDVEMLTFEPTFALLLKLPTLVITADELTNELTVELPTRNVDVDDVRLAIPTDVTDVLLAIKLDPTVKLSTLTVPV